MSNNTINYLFNILVKDNNVLAVFNKVEHGIQTVNAAIQQLNDSFNTNLTHIQKSIDKISFSAFLQKVQSAVQGINDLIQLDGGDLPQIKAALVQSGMAAKAAGISFEKTNVAIQLLYKAGKKGAEGAIALRNVLYTLSQGEFLPKNVQTELQAASVAIGTLTNQNTTLTESLNPLIVIMANAALVTELFGKENINAALAILFSINEINNLTFAIAITSLVMEQAAVVMQNLTENAERLTAFIDELTTSFFNAASSVDQYLNAISDGVQDALNIHGALSLVGDIINFVTEVQKIYNFWMNIVSDATKIWTEAQRLLNLVLNANPITLIIAGIIALIAIIGYVIYAYDGWGNAWNHLIDGLKATWFAFGAVFKLMWLETVDEFMNGVERIQRAWYKVKSLWDEDGANAGLAKLNADSQARADAIAKQRDVIASHGKTAGDSFGKIFGKDGIHANGNSLQIFTPTSETTPKTTSTPNKTAPVATGTAPPQVPGTTTFIDDLKTALFNATNAIIQYLNAISDVVQDVALNIHAALSLVGDIINFVTEVQEIYNFWMNIISDVTQIWEDAQWLLNLALNANPIALIIAGIIALIAIIGYVIYAYDGWGNAWNHLIDGLKATWFAFGAVFKLMWLETVDEFMNGVERIQRAWYKVKSLWDEDGANAGLAKLNADSQARAEAIAKQKGVIASHGKTAGDSFGKIFGKDGIHANGNSLQIFTPTSETTKKITSTPKKTAPVATGVAPPQVPGTTTQNTSKKIAEATGVNKSTEAIATGGSKNTQITFNLKDLIGVLNINAAGIKEGINTMEQEVTDALLRVLASAQATAG